MLANRIARRASRVGCTLIAFFVLSVPAWSWGPLGHRIVAKIAEKHLHPQALHRFQLLAGRGVALDSVANWADEIRESRPETAPWHYINISPGAKELDLQRDCPAADCVTLKTREFQGLVRLGMRKKEERLDALRFLIHFMADLHQPLHAGYGRDCGGNDITISVRGEEMNLHRYWDSALLADRIDDEDAFVAQVLAELSSADEKEWSRGHLREWTWESHELAAKAAYGALPEGAPRTIDDEYAGQAWQVAREQLTKGGLRLAIMMNEMWGY